MKRDQVTVYSHSERETLAIGAIMGAIMKAGDVVGLSGELGSGKTCFTRGIAEGLQVSHHYCIASPTFTLVNEYPGRVPLIHMDMYRLSDSSQISEIGFDEYLEGGSVVVVEWAEKISDMFPAHSFQVTIAHCHEQERKLDIEGRTDAIVYLKGKLREGGLI